MFPHPSGPTPLQISDVVPLPVPANWAVGVATHNGQRMIILKIDDVTGIKVLFLDEGSALNLADAIRANASGLHIQTALPLIQQKGN